MIKSTQNQTMNLDEVKISEGIKVPAGRSWLRWNTSLIKGTGLVLVNLILWSSDSVKNRCIAACNQLSPNSTDTIKKTDLLVKETLSLKNGKLEFKSDKKTNITQDEISSYRRGKEVVYGDLDDGSTVALIDDLNKQGAIRALSAYLTCFSLRIQKNGEGLYTLVTTPFLSKFTLNEAELANINKHLSKVLNGSTKENELTNEIHKAFKSEIKKREDAKSIAYEIALIRGKEIPHTMKNRIVIQPNGSAPKIVIEEMLKASNLSKGVRISSGRDNPNLQDIPTNLFTHEINITANDKTITKKFVRGGAPCSHLKPTTEKLIKEAEEILGLRGRDPLSTYTRVKLILESNNLELNSLKEVLAKRLQDATTQMKERLENAYKIDPQNQSWTFHHAEMSLLSPGHTKERSMVLDAEMGMENLSQNYQIDANTGSVKESDKNSPHPKMKKINIILTQMAVNQDQFTTCRVQENINLRAVEQLRRVVISKSGSLTKEKKTQASELLNEIEKRSKDPNRLFSDEKIVHNFNQVFEILDITQGFFCKSGKDRTAQGVIDGIIEKITDDLINTPAVDPSKNDTMHFLTGTAYGLYNLVYPLKNRVKSKVKAALQIRGLSFLLTGANTLKKNAYAFHPLQMAIMPDFVKVSNWQKCYSVGT
jgi:hypothetical protein